MFPRHGSSPARNPAGGPGVGTRDGGSPPPPEETTIAATAHPQTVGPPQPDHSRAGHSRAGHPHTAWRDVPTASDGAEVPPRPAEGVELIGEYEGSGFKKAPYLARRGDGQTVQLTRLLYLVAEAADGSRDGPTSTTTALTGRGSGG